MNDSVAPPIVLTRSSNSSRIVFELDVYPPSVFPHSALDYAGRLVAGFQSRPLFHYPDWSKSVSKGLIGHYEAFNNAKKWKLTIVQGANLPCGTTISANMLASSLTPCTQMALNPASRFLKQEVKEVKAKGKNEVIVTLKRPIPYLPEILSSDYFSTINVTKRTFLTGPYTIARKANNTVIALVKNKVGEILYPEGPESVYFVVTKSPEDGAMLFEQGVIDVTSNPNLPAKIATLYNDSPNLVRNKLAMAGVLIPKMLEHTSWASNLLDNKRVCAAVKFGVSPLWHLMDLFESKESEPNIDSTQGVCTFMKKKKLYIAYANFAPNDIVVNEIAHNLSQPGGPTVIPVALSYTDYLTELKERNFDFVYTLIQPSLPEPVSFLKQILTSCSMFDDEIESITRQLAVDNYQNRIDYCRQYLLDNAARIALIPVLRHESKFLISDVTLNKVLSLTSDGLLKPKFRVGMDI